MKSNTCKCKQGSRRRHIRKITRRRGGSKFSRFATYFPKRLSGYTTAQIAAHVGNDNLGLYIGKTIRPIKNYLLSDKSNINMPQPIVETFKPAIMHNNNNNNFIIPVPKANVPIGNRDKVIDLTSIQRQIRPILYQRDKSSSHPSHRSSHRSHHSSHESISSSQSHTAIRSSGP